MGSVVSFWKSTIRCIHSISAVVDEVSLARASRSARRSRSASSARWAAVTVDPFLAPSGLPPSGRPAWWRPWTVLLPRPLVAVPSLPGLAADPRGPGGAPVRSGRAGFSLYPQWAAIPYSARRCISWVRTCTSMGLPSRPITVVCSDW